MTRTIAGLVALVTMMSVAPAMAQDKRVEASVLLGWTFSDGVSGNSVVAGDGNIYNRIDPKDSFKWGLDVGVFTSEQVQVGFLFSQQMSKLTVGGTNTVEVGDMTTSNYHGYFAYNWLDSDAKVRPYFMGGLGATHYPAVGFTKLNGAGTGTTFSSTRFSSTWGAGIKAFPSPNVGVRAGVQFTPTFIKSDAAGWWCDPWYGCYVVGDAQYSNQWDVSGGLTFRF